MKKYIIFLSAILMMMLTGCTDVLDKSNQMVYSDDDVWNSDTYAEEFLNNLYKSNNPGWEDLAGWSDEGDGGNTTILYGQVTVSSITTWNYSKIRQINVLLQKVDDTTNGLSADARKLLKGQALILRAYKYWEMVRLYGGVPMILVPQEQTDDLYVTRNKTSECITQICKDLEDAYSMLPWTWTGDDAGRFTKATALALEGRILMYYASPQFTPSGSTERWQKAYEVNKKAYEELSANGYGLYEDYANIWFNEMNKEDVMVHRYWSTGEGIGESNHWNAGTRPLSQAINYAGYNHPTWNLVKMYPMKDGKSITESSEYDSIHFWRNRDPRFAKTIAYNGCVWELSGISGRYQWNYVGAEGNYDTKTGFFCRKAVDTSLTPFMSQFSSTDWVEIRFAEVMMNYAECAAEVGNNDVAYTMLKAIRKRAGITAGTDGMYGLKSGLTKDGMITAIMNEREIEFAFEAKRFWDLRRRRLFASELNGKARYGMRPTLLSGVTGDAVAAAVKNGVNIDTDYTNYFKDEWFNTDLSYRINFLDNYYFFPISQANLQTNSKLEQTSGWENGTFDPLQ
jgi:hypothetical protein